jgi:LmbE family N-acetylglucosaminyl deacetylase
LLQPGPFCRWCSWALRGVSGRRRRRFLSKKRKTRPFCCSRHPDDDTFSCAGTLALLTKQHNKIHIALYTNDDKGSYDPEMTSQRLARIRSAEEEEACRVIGIPKENIHWFQFHDGMLEYTNPLDLVEQATKVLRTYRPDIVITIDPG